MKTDRNNETFKTRGWLFRSFKRRLITYFSLVFAAILILVQLVMWFGVPFLPISGETERDTRDVFRNLDLVADLKKERLTRWLEERKDDTAVVARSDIIGSYVSRFITIVRKNAAQNMTGEKILKAMQEEKIFRDLNQHLNIIRDVYSVYNRIDVIDASTGMIMASTEKNAMGAHIPPSYYIQKALKSGGLAAYFERDIDSGFIELHFAYPIEYSAKGMGKFAGIIIMHINTDDFIKPLLHTGEGLGETGEALLVDRDVRTITSLKYPLHDGGFAKPLEYEIEAKPALLAARGEEGIIEAKDYRGEEVLAAYRHINVTEDVGWGLVVKRDRRELFSHIREEMLFTVAIGISGIMVIIIVSVVLGGKFTGPVMSLSHTAEKVASGDLSARAPVVSGDEIGALSVTFNSMVDRIKNWNEELSDHVRLQTEQLRNTNEDLMTEIFEREVAEVSLKQSEEKYRRLFEDANDSIFIVDPDNLSFLDVNENAARRLGYTRNELLDMTVNDIDASIVSNRNEAVINQLRETGSVVFEHSHKHKDGTAIRVEISSRMIEFGDRKVIQSFVRDITARKKAQEALSREVRVNSAVAALSTALISRASLDDISFMVLDHAKRLTGSEFGYVGYIDEESGHLVCPTLTRDVWDKCEVPEKDIVFKKLAGLWGWVLDNRKSLITNEPAEDNRSSGTPPGHVPIRNFASAPAVVGEKLVGQVALANQEDGYTDRDLVLIERLAALYAIAVQRNRDEEQLSKYREHLESLVEERTSDLMAINKELEQEMTERKRAEAEAVRAGHLASLGELAAGVAHEINNPINGIINYAQILLDEVGDNGVVDEMSQRIIKESDRIAFIVKSLLSFAREVGEEKKPVEINELMSESFAILGAQMRKEGIELSMDLPSSLQMVMAHPQQIQQVIMNIISNARHALNQKYPDRHEDKTVEITGEEITVDDREYVRIKFHDNGTGIPADIIEKVMNPFVTTKTDGIGTGLGLSISHGIITDHGGKITIESVEGEYTNVVIDLPLW